VYVCVCVICDSLTIYSSREHCTGTLTHTDKHAMVQQQHKKKKPEKKAATKSTPPLHSESTGSPIARTAASKLTDVSHGFSGGFVTPRSAATTVGAAIQSPSIK
jgi:hypothetical protein